MAQIPGRLTTLRPMEREDIALLHRWLNDPDVMQHWDGRDHPATFDRVEARFARSVEGSDRETQRFMIVTGGTGPDSPPAGRTIGMVQHGRPQPRTRVAQVDLLIGDPEFRDSGYGTDAMRALLAHLFEQQRIHRVWLSLRANNLRALHAAEKCGFAREGVLREHDFIEGKRVDVVVFGVLAHEWKARKGEAG